MMLDIHDVLRRDEATVAVVGASEDPAKYGSVIFMDLVRKGYTVFPVNPKRDFIHGVPAYADLASLPVVPTIVNVVVPPDVTLAVLDEAEALGIRSIWLQPGAESPAVLERLEDGPFDYLANACIMIQTRLHA